MLRYTDIDNLRIFYKVNNLEAYPPQEDSFMFIKYLNFKNKKVLDLGCGSGILGIYALKNNNNVIFADIDEEALIISKINVVYNFIDRINPETILSKLETYSNAFNRIGTKFVKTNLFENIKEKFDIVIFNPPYLPKEGIEDKKTELWTVAGENGYEIILEFLKQLKYHLNDRGYALLLYSSLSNPIIIEKTAIDLGYKIQILEKKNLFFEKLYLSKLTLK